MEIEGEKGGKQTKRDSVSIYEYDKHNFEMIWFQNPWFKKKPENPEKCQNTPKKAIKC